MECVTKLGFTRMLLECNQNAMFMKLCPPSLSVKTRIHVKVRLLSLKWYFSQVDFLADFNMPFHWLLVDHPSTIPWLPIAIFIQKKLVIWDYLTNFTSGWLKYHLNDKNLTKPDFYMNSRFYRASLSRHLNSKWEAVGKLNGSRLGISPVTHVGFLDGYCI